MRLGFCLVFFFGLSSLFAQDLDSTGSDRDDVPAKPRKLYFSDLQMVVETVPEGSCPDDQRITERVEEGFKVDLGSDKKLLRKNGKRSVEFYALNVNVQKIGFDNGKYSFSVLDGMVPENAPHKMRVRRRPGNFIDIYYLEEVLKLQLNQAPIYSFTAVEKRGKCTINHNINIFAENQGYYEPKDP